MTITAPLSIAGLFLCLAGAAIAGPAERFSPATTQLPSAASFLQSNNLSTPGDAAEARDLKQRLMQMQTLAEKGREAWVAYNNNPSDETIYALKSMADKGSGVATIGYAEVIEKERAAGESIEISPEDYLVEAAATLTPAEQILPSKLLSAAYSQGLMGVAVDYDKAEFYQDHARRNINAINTMRARYMQICTSRNTNPHIDSICR